MTWVAQSTHRLVVTLILGSTAILAQDQGGGADPMALVQQARKLNNQGKQAEALSLYRKVLTASPDSFEANLGAGIALDLEGDYAEARRHIAKAIEEATPQNKVQALRTMAMSYAFEGKASESEKFEKQVFDRQLAEQNFIAAAESADELARVFLESGNPDKAYEWYQLGYKTAQRKTDLTAAERDLWELRWEHALARIRARQGKQEEALQHAAKVKALVDNGRNPDQARFYPYLAGYIAFYAHDFKAAISELQKADQRDPFILSLLAQAYEKSGDKAQALTYYEKVMAVNSHNPTNAFARPLARTKVRS